MLNIVIIIEVGFVINVFRQKINRYLGKFWNNLMRNHIVYRNQLLMKFN